MEPRTTDRRVVWLVAAPQLVLIAAGVAVLAAGALGRDRQWTDEPLNLSAAISSRDWGQAILRIEQGEDPNQPHVVQFHDNPRIITPLEAAVREDELDLVVTVMRLGAVADAAERLRLACMALARDAPDIAEHLLGSAPTESQCAVPSSATDTDPR